jgi:hypothetical protein
LRSIEKALANPAQRLPDSTSQELDRKKTLAPEITAGVCSIESQDPSATCRRRAGEDLSSS